MAELREIRERVASRREMGGAVIFDRGDGADCAALLALVDELADKLDDCAARLARAIIASGSDPEYADLAVAKYRDLLKKLEG